MGYRRIESLRHYVLVDQDKMVVLHYRKSDGTTWMLETPDKPDDQLALTAGGGSIGVGQIYRRISLSESEA